MEAAAVPQLMAFARLFQACRLVRAMRHRLADFDN
jgi:hypothetical protein